MRILDSPEAISTAQKEFERSVLALAQETIAVVIGFPSGDTPATVHWIPALGIWAYFGEPPREKSPGERYWTVFGVGMPSGLVPIACEINSPKSGINRQAAGAFAFGEGGSDHLVHRGIFTAGGRVDYEYTRFRFRWKWIDVSDGDKTSRVMPIAELHSPSLGSSVSDFVMEVARFKEAARVRPRKKTR